MNAEYHLYPPPGTNVTVVTGHGDIEIYCVERPHEPTPAPVGEGPNYKAVVDHLAKIWNDPPCPSEQRNRLRREWPALSNALEGLTLPLVFWCSDVLSPVSQAALESSRQVDVTLAPVQVDR